MDLTATQMPLVDIDELAEEKVPDSPMARMRGLVWFGLFMLVVFLGGFTIWSIFAPLESAAVASGTVQVESSHRTVSHLEGGIVGEILVKDGDYVHQGQVLIRLEATKAQTTHDSVQGALWDAYARRARLIAERDGRAHIAFPDDLVIRAQKNGLVTDVLAGQRKIFETRHELLTSKIDLIRQRIAQTMEEIRGIEAQQEAARSKLVLIDEQLQDQRELIAKNLARKPQFLELQRQQADIAGTIGATAAQIARAHENIAELKISIISERNNTATEVAQQLRDTEEKIHEMEEQLRAAADVLSRVEVQATEAGYVTELKLHTPGGVVKPGDPLLDLVPRKDELVIQARVRPEDIDLVRPGLPVSIRLLPYKQRRTPPIEGTVLTVSADRVVEGSQQMPGSSGPMSEPYYATRIQLSRESLDSVPEIQLVPGMPAEVMIKTGKTVVALYALSPILDSFHRAFRQK